MNGVILVKKAICLLLVFLAAFPLCSCAKKTYSITFDKDYDEVISAPKKARAGELVEIRTCIIMDADIRVYADGDSVAMVHYDSDFWAYAFNMPEHDVVLSLEFCGEKGDYVQGDIPEQEDGGAPMETVEIISTADWLPNWPMTSGGLDEYAEVTPDMMNGYVEALEREGFTLIGGKWSKLLIRGDVWISIADNTEAYNSASVAVTLRTASDGMSLDEAITVIGKAGMSAPARAAIEITPLGLYEETGLQIFKAVFDEPPTETVLDPVFTVKTFILGGGAVFEISLTDAVWADIDGDEASEAVVLEYGPTSGVCSIVLSVFRLENGNAVRSASSMYVLDHNSFWLKTADGKVFLNVDGAEYELIVSGEGVLIDDPSNTLKIMK